MTSNQYSTIAILGGGGKAGRPLVQEALNAGYRVRLLLRHPETFPLFHDRLTILQGDARDKASLRELMQGCQALLSTLGHTKGEPEPIISTVTQHILSVLQEFRINRYVVVTSLYTTGKEQSDEKTHQAAEFMHTHFPRMMADRQKEFHLITESNLDWTYVRLPYLVQEPATGRVQANPDHLPGSQITVDDLAQFLVQELESGHYIRQAPFVAN